MDILDYNQLRKEFTQRKREAKQYWKKTTKKEEPKRTKREQKKQDFWVHLVTEPASAVG